MSNINREYKNIYVHIPKTAGRNMEKHDFVRGTGHDTLNMLIGDEHYPDYIKWTFVRNPFKRLISAFFYHSAPVLLNFSLQIFNNDTRAPEKTERGFRYFVDQLYDNKEKFYTLMDNEVQSDGFIHFMPMHYFVSHPVIKMDFIGRFENMNEDFNKVCDMVRDNINFPAFKNRVTNELLYDPSQIVADRKVITDNSTIKKVKDIYALDYDMFSY